MSARVSTSGLVRISLAPVTTPVIAVWSTLAIAASLVGAPVAQAQPETAAEPRFVVHTWQGERIEADRIEIRKASIGLETGGTSRTLGWHRVRMVDGPTGPEAEAMLSLGRDVWRAVSRLERGDSFGAEPLFESAFERTRGSIGPTPAAVADGLLRCRLRRDARAAAIDAWLELAANLQAAPASNPNWGLRVPALDRRTRLVPSLPPIWFDSLPARAFADSLVLDPGVLDQSPTGVPSIKQTEPDPDRVRITRGSANAIRTLYQAAARHALGDPIDPTVTARAVDAASVRDGGRLVARVVLAQIGGAEDRAAARAALAKELEGRDDRWRAVWASIAIGRSLLREPDPSEQRRGVLALLAVHAIDAEVSPYLTGIALADAAIATERLGDHAAADAIRADLARDYPNHPVRRLPGLAFQNTTPKPGVS